MAGPLVKVNTITAAVSLDVSRVLYTGKNLTFEFLVPDVNETGGLRMVKTLTKGFDRIGFNAVTNGDAKFVYFRVADKIGDLAATLRLPQLHVRISDGSGAYLVQSVDKPEPNVAQVYTLSCVTRTLRTNFEVR